jgi:single-strand DNA-binding protein
MANFNKVILAGNLTRDPQLSYLPSNTAVCEFGLAINRKWRSQNGEMKDETCFVEIRAYGKPAETLNQYMNKGKPLMVEGRLKYDQWEGKDGQKRSKLYVIAENFQFLGSAGGAGGGNRGGQERQVASSAPRGQIADEMPPMDEATAPTGEDIPF